MERCPVEKIGQSGMSVVWKADNIIVGQVDDGLLFTFIWIEQTGMRNLQEYLENDIGLDLIGWTLTDAHSISAFRYFST